jgi:hypothetical protein
MRSLVAGLDRHPWLFSLVLILVVAVPGFIRVEAINNKTDETVACVQEWAEANSNRTRTVSAANQKRQDATDTLIRSVAIAQTDPGAWTKAYEAYIEASDDYTETIKKNPVPPPPTDICVN